MQPQNVFLLTFIRNLFTNGVRAFDSCTEISYVTSCIDWL